MKTQSKNKNNILIANTNQSTFYTQENKNIPFPKPKFKYFK